ncbi:hypothetical protein SAMN02745129_2521 [Ferrimonas marina]|uniref:Uncharacterized protein n=1 Tax=Ferrimonas marina TaxID=299255 RepID=A0A1M5UDM4_9GAMM|nr:hypothetical protein SAMN02745129_2521 [Ferrimonas marina]
MKVKCLGPTGPTDVLVIPGRTGGFEPIRIGPVPPIGQKLDRHNCRHVTLHINLTEPVGDQECLLYRQPDYGLRSTYRLDPGGHEDGRVLLIVQSLSDIPGQMTLNGDIRLIDEGYWRKPPAVCRPRTRYRRFGPEKDLRPRVPAGVINGNGCLRFPVLLAAGPCSIEWRQPGNYGSHLFAYLAEYDGRTWRTTNIAPELMKQTA